MPENNVPNFETKEEYASYVQSLHKGAELLNAQNQNQKPNEDTIKEIVSKQVDEAKKSFVDEKEARLTKVFLGDEDNINAIKKTFKETKDFDAWHKEAQEGKASNREIELLAARGNKIIEREAKEAEKEKEAEVAKAKETASNVNVKRSWDDVHKEVFKIQNDEKSAFDNVGQYKTKEEQQKRLVEDCNKIAEIIASADQENMNPHEKKQLAVFNEMIMDIKTKAATIQDYEKYSKQLNGGFTPPGFGGHADYRTGMNPDGTRVVADNTPQ